MNLVNFYFGKNELHLIFDTEFKHIKYEKYEKSETNKVQENIIGLEHDYTELTFTKPKKEIVIFTNVYSDIVIINIKEIDNKTFCFSNLFIKTKNSNDLSDSKDSNELVLNGLTSLLSNDFMKLGTPMSLPNTVNSTNKKVITQLKNENISAEFIRK